MGRWWSFWARCGGLSEGRKEGMQEGGVGGVGEGKGK